jgi:hypothetical protein
MTIARAALVLVLFGLAIAVAAAVLATAGTSAGEPPCASTATCAHPWWA